MSHEPADPRALSPVVGTVLLLAIVLLLVAVSSSLIFGLTEQQDPAPQAKLDLVATDTPGEYRLVHEAGDTIDGEQLTLRGVADPDALAGRELAAGESVVVDAERETVRVVWTEREGAPSSYVLSAFEVSGAVAGGFAGGTVFTGSAGGVVAVAGDGGSVTTVSNTSDVAALGPLGTDVTGDGTADVPYVTTGESVKVVDSTGDVTTVADSGDISGSVETSKTRLAIGSWDGSPASVFFVNQNHDTLYRATPGGAPQTVATPGNGVQAVVGIGDVDADGTDDLVFADGSQQLRYVDGPSGPIRNVNNGQTGSNNGIGAGSLADIDGDGTPAIVAIDGSNDLKINREPSGGGTTTVSAVDAAKSPVAVADVDGDGAAEVVYVGLSSGDVKYVDDVFGANTVRLLEDDGGTAVPGSDESGVV
ncbi:FG-GAP repeat domain-containing protein [Haloarcula litorea]|uniref:FG-GAP repeat domain-containing protein n=1 Tax=Haloarcula litorea TaxID=3032579 RepID=UPI0023E8E603|nr:VCBS repeat-containing protein [Halomicroarcula sp. GDY20]